MTLGLTICVWSNKRETVMLLEIHMNVQLQIFLNQQSKMIGEGKSIIIFRQCVIFFQVHLSMDYVCII